MKLSEIEGRIVVLEQMVHKPVSFDSLFRRIEALEKALLDVIAELDRLDSEQ
jgi:hypothetical protein